MPTDCLFFFFFLGVCRTDLRRIIVSAERAVFRVPGAGGEPVILTMAKG